MAPLPYKDPKLLKKLKRLLKSPRTIAELEEKLGLSRRTVYNYIYALRDDEGLPVDREGISRPTKYVIR